MNVMITAAEKAGRGLRRDFGEVENLQVSRKGPGDFVSNADMRSERIIVDVLRQARPGYGFLLEESGEIAGDDPSHRWVVDPLDGTTNFLHGIPYFAVSIALERSGRLVAGVVYNPVTDDMYHAERGGGAFHNRRKLRVAARTVLGDAVLATGGRVARSADPHPSLPQVGALRRFGAASLDLAYVASGRVDAFWETGLRPWDMAAGIVIVRESGGLVSDDVGRGPFLENGTVLAGNESMHAALLKFTTRPAAPPPNAGSADRLP